MADQGDGTHIFPVPPLPSWRARVASAVHAITAHPACAFFFAVSFAALIGLWFSSGEPAIMIPAAIVGWFFGTLGWCFAPGLSKLAKALWIAFTALIFAMETTYLYRHYHPNWHPFDQQQQLKQSPPHKAIQKVPSVKAAPTAPRIPPPPRQHKHKRRRIVGPSPITPTPPSVAVPAPNSAAETPSCQPANEPIVTTITAFNGLSNAALSARVKTNTIVLRALEDSYAQKLLSAAQNGSQNFDATHVLIEKTKADEQAEFRVHLMEIRDLNDELLKRLHLPHQFCNSVIPPTARSALDSGEVYEGTPLHGLADYMDGLATKLPKG